jgi:hypothetical protein
MLTEINTAACVLFLGSGYSADCKNILGSKPPVGDDLRQELLALLWQFGLARFGEECLTVGASLGRRPCEEIEDGLPDGRHARLWRRSADSFFSVPLL